MITHNIAGAIYSSKPYWNVTESSSSDIKFRRDVMLTPASSIGIIRSLGSTWSDLANSDFPAHDSSWKRNMSISKLCIAMSEAIMEENGTYNRVPKFMGYQTSTIGFSLVKVFLASHDTEDVEHNHDELVQWIRGSRTFFAGAETLADAAKRRCHPILV